MRTELRKFAAKNKGFKRVIKVLKSRLVGLFFLETLLVIGIIGYVAWRGGLINFQKALPADPTMALVNTLVKTCSKPLAYGKEICYQKQFEQLAAKSGPSYAFQVLYKLQTQDSSTQSCHLIAHGLGQGAFENNSKNWQTIINTIDPSCNYGAVHGVIQAHVSTLPGGKLTAQILPTLCGPTPRGDCNHIVGHLVLVETKGQVNPALEMCSVFTDPVQLHYCYAGVFMENQTVDNLIEHGYADASWKDLAARIDGIEALCRGFAGMGEKETACWESIAYSAMAKYSTVAKDVLSFCDRSPSDLGASLCKRYALVLFATEQDFAISYLTYVCQIPQSREPGFETDCYDNLVADLVLIVPKEAARGVSFCNGIESAFQDGCFATLGSAAKQAGILSPAELKTVCANAPSRYQLECENNANPYSVPLPPDPNYGSRVN